MTRSCNCLSRACAALALVGLLAAPARAQTTSPALGAARLGYETYAVANGIAAPAALASDDAQRFVDATYRDIAARADAPLRARFATLRPALAAGATVDPVALGRSWLTASRDLGSTFDGDDFGAFSLGSLAATVTFNARVLREDATDAIFRNGIGEQRALDASVPGLADARAKLAADAPGDWDAIAADADALAARFLGAPPPALRPAPRAVWALLVRGRPIAADGPRRGTLHASLDIVYGDGSHTTIGAYPDGIDDFSATGGTLTCRTGLESFAGPSRAYPLAPPKGVTADALAERFLAACKAFDKHRPRFRYLPQEERHANDNAFVADLLRAASLDLPRGL